MTSPLFNYFYRVEIQLANYELGAIKPGSTAVRDVVTKTYNFVNKRLKDAATSSERETYLPTLKSVGEITLSAGEVLPTASFSSITLEDSRGSFGRDRRFSDLLERSTVIGQPVSFYLGESEIDTDAPPSWKLLGTGRVASWSKALSGETPDITIQIQPSKISDRVVNIEVSRDIPGMQNAPDSSLNKAVPVTFCRTNYNPRMEHPAQEVSPIRISSDGLSSAKYALTTQMYQVTKAIPSPYIFVKKNWPESTFDWLGLYFPPPVVPDYTTSVVIGSYYTLNTYASLAYRIPEILKTSNSEGFIVTAVELRMRGQSTNPARVSTAYLSVYILMVDRVTSSVVEELGRGRAALATYDANNNAFNSTFSVKISLDRPVMVDLTSTREYDFYLGFEATDVVAGQEMVIYKNTTGAPHKTLFKQVPTGAGDNFTDWKVSTDSTGIIAHKLHYASATFTDHENLFTPDGLTYSSMSLTQTTADVGQVNPELDSLNIVTHVEGFADYTTGNRIYDPPTVLKTLSYEWDGEKWEDKNAFDITTLQASHYTPLFSPSSGNHRARVLGGIIESKSTYAQALSEVARGTASKIGILSDGKLFIHPWGVVTGPDYIIPQQDIIPLTWETRDEASIVNRAQISFERGFLNTEQQGGSLNYSIDFSSANYLPVRAITERSRSIYGTKPILDNSFPVFGHSRIAKGPTLPVVGLPGYLIGVSSNSTPGNPAQFCTDFLAEYYISRFALPFVYCSFVVPYHRYKDIRMFDVISFHHSEFPAFYGTDPNARPGVVNDGTSVTAVQGANGGEEFVRAKSYRGLVEGVSYVMAMEHAPAIRLTVQVLVNTEFDPT